MSARSPHRGRVQPEEPGGKNASNAELRALADRQLDNHHAVDKRVAVLEAELKHLATKNDVSKVKLWAITTGLAALGTVALVVLGYLRLLPLPTG